jgi:hypothetical protein
MASFTVVFAPELYLLLHELIFSFSPPFYSFGYVVEGEDFLRDMKEGDVIVSAKVTEGLDNLVKP